MPAINTIPHVRFSVLEGLVATGSSQADAFPLVNDSFYQFVTVDSGTGALLPVAKIPSQVTLWNGGANALSVYPPVGGTINDEVVNAPYSVAMASAASIFATDAGTWYVIASSGGTPAPAPSFSAFAISGQATTLEVGATIASGSKTFTWTTVNPSSVRANSIEIDDTTGSTVLATGLADDSSEAISISSITNNSPTSNVWTVRGTSVASASFSRTFTVSWLWRVYAGSSANATLTANQIKALSDSSSLQSGFAGTYSITNASPVFYYFAFPDSLGSPSLFFDPVNNFALDMADSSANAAYSNVANDYSYALVSVQNAQLVTTNYRVYRTTNTFAAQPLSMRVS